MVKGFFKVGSIKKFTIFVKEYTSKEPIIICYPYARGESLDTLTIWEAKEMIRMLEEAVKVVEEKKIEFP